jgi:hypothetical protein
MNRYIYTVVIFIITSAAPLVYGQNRPSKSIVNAPTTGMWNGFYGKFRLTNKIFWDAQFHYRRVGDDQLDYVGRMAQIYNRHALSYLVNNRFSVSLGGVLRLNFTPEPGNSNFRNVVLEPRIWHEYLFAMPLWNSMVYHRVRIEHRWSVGNATDAEWMFRNRWRYKFYMNIPLNKPRLMPGALYFTPDIEIIMQTGARVIDSPLEDFRVNPSLGYIFNPNVKFTAGVMYTTGQTLSAGYVYTSRWILRTNLYISMDLRKKQARIPSTRFFD